MYQTPFCTECSLDTTDAIQIQDVQYLRLPAPARLGTSTNALGLAGIGRGEDSKNLQLENRRLL